MNTEPAPQNAVDVKLEQESRISVLLDEFTDIRNILDPTIKPDLPVPPILEDIDELKRRLEKLKPDGSELSSTELTSLKHEIKWIKEKAVQESIKLKHLGDVSDIQKTLNSLQGVASGSLTEPVKSLAKAEEIKKQLLLLKVDGSERLFFELSSLEGEVDKTKKETDLISRWVVQENKRNYLLKEISLIRDKEPSLSTILLEKIKDVEDKLKELIPDGSEALSSTLDTREREINNIKDELSRKREAKLFWPRTKGFLNSILGLPGKIDKTIWVAIIGAITTIYLGYVNNLQNKDQPDSSANLTATAASTIIVATSSFVEDTSVSFSNPDTNWMPVKIVIRDADQLKEDPISGPIIEPGNKATFQDLKPGNYHIEIIPVYPEMALQSSNCSIQWPPEESYKGNLVLTSGKTVIEIKHFSYKPQETCITETPSPTLPVPTP